MTHLLPLSAIGYLDFHTVTGILNIYCSFNIEKKTDCSLLMFKENQFNVKKTENVTFIQQKRKNQLRRRGLLFFVRIIGDRVE